MALLLVKIKSQYYVYIYVIFSRAISFTCTRDSHRIIKWWARVYDLDIIDGNPVRLLEYSETSMKTQTMRATNPMWLRHLRECLLTK